ncbi:MAG: hypothetical protein Q4G07_10580 [Oscillospiraceae bacterium]|nr:hypothetical protein [Oscillospiraceae bacterium]
MAQSSSVSSMVKGAAAGVLTGAALGMAGAYLVSGDRHQLGKTMKKAEKKAIQALSGIDKMLDR